MLVDLNDDKVRLYRIKDTVLYYVAHGLSVPAQSRAQGEEVASVEFNPPELEKRYYELGVIEPIDKFTKEEWAKKQGVEIPKEPVSPGVPPVASSAPSPVVAKESPATTHTPEPPVASSAPSPVVKESAPEPVAAKESPNQLGGLSVPEISETTEADTPAARRGKKKSGDDPNVG